ncbi:MAG TPA: methyltransferase [Nocardioides sp.]|uniref:methyltransferase n=1 Tax=Nocardioides sp. TaxID=35761 RepID=UPI002D802CA8|nr:methyltransferase [Nocardioides sp.]HET6651045.1 methyltransferase [Nocardioides sp.]
MTLTMRVGSLDVRYDESVLEPRPWTAAQAELAADVARDLAHGPLLELCCGAGHIGLLAALLSHRDAVLVDLNEAACRFSEDNATQVRATGVSVSVRHGEMTDVLDEGEQFPLVLADPPYIPSHQTGHFPTDPLVAIDGGADGLDLARTCVHVGARHLTPGGALVLQLRDRDQAQVLADDAMRHGLVDPEVTQVGGHGALLLLRKKL